MEEPRGDFCADEGCAGDVVVEKYLAESKASASHVQLACRGPHCAFPVDGNELRVWNAEDPSCQVFGSWLCFSLSQVPREPCRHLSFSLMLFG